MNCNIKGETKRNETNKQIEKRNLQTRQKVKKHRNEMRVCSLANVTFA